MKIFFKFMFFISLIINALNECTGKDKTACDSDSTCTWVAQVVPAECTAIANIMASECSVAGNATECAEIESTEEAELCAFDETCSDDATTIQNSKLEIQNSKYGGIYDLSGRRDMGQGARGKEQEDSSLFTLHSSLKKGLCIVNGKKVAFQCIVHSTQFR